MSPLLYQTIQNFFTPFLSTVFFLAFLFDTQSLPKDTLKRFRLAGFTVLLLVFADGIQYYCEGLSYFTPIRKWAAAFGYLFRPSILYYILMIYLRRRPNRYRYLLSIPLVLTAICSFAAFFTDLSFYYTADNILVRGPLISMPFIASFFYFFAILFESARNIRIGDNRETFMLLVVLFVAAVATVLEATLRFSGLLSGFCTIGIIFYYLFFMVDSFTHDQLTDAYRRERLYRDISVMQSVFGIIAFDINDLKKINDNLGHAEGDKAISTISHVVENCLTRNSRLYRVGGDEFVILMNTNKEEDIAFLESNIQNAISRTKYSIAIGGVLSEEGESLENAMSRADEIMYAVKRAMKQNNQK